MEGFQFIDIIFFAMVAAFLILRLRGVLGRRTGNEKRRPNPYAAPESKDRSAERDEPDDDDTIIPLPERDPFSDPGRPKSPLDATLTRIQVADPTFDPGSFMEGARAAFEMIVGAYAAGDTETLKPLLHEDVYAGFAQAIKTREAAGEEMSNELVGFSSVRIIDADLQGSYAQVVIEFVTDQVIVVRDRTGEVVEGDPNRIERVTDIWTFARDTRSSDPNWILVATATPDEIEDEEEEGSRGDGSKGDI